MMIQSIMLVSLGFLTASLLALVLAPALWKRAVRLTTDRIKISMPVKMSEINADKDQLRAEFAIKIRKYESELEKSNTLAAKQLVEISRRDAEIKSLESKISGIVDDLEEQKNANRVYEQTIALRIPKMEAQLHKAKEILGARYQEITQLRTTLTTQEGKLGQAKTLDQMRQAEMERLKLALDQNVVGGDSKEADKSITASKYEDTLNKNKELEEEIIKLRRLVDQSEKETSKKSNVFRSEIKSFAERIASISGIPDSNGEAKERRESEANGSGESVAIAAMSDDDSIEDDTEFDKANEKRDNLSGETLSFGSDVIENPDTAITGNAMASEENAELENDDSSDLIDDIFEETEEQEEDHREEIAAFEAKEDDEQTDAALESEGDEQSTEDGEKSTLIDKLKSGPVSTKKERPSLANLRLSDRLKILQGSN